MAESNLPVTVLLSAYRGDSWSQRFRFLRDSTPVNLSSATVEAQAQRGGVYSDLVVTIVEPTDGMIALALPSGGLAPALYDYDIEVTDQGVVTTWVRGKLTVDRDVTNAGP
jgi:hypothetical protein